MGKCESRPGLVKMSGSNESLSRADHSYVLNLNTPVEEKVVPGASDQAVLNLSKKNLKKVPKPEDAQNLRALVLDENELQKVDNIDSFLRIERVRERTARKSFATFMSTLPPAFQLSISKNSLMRMYGIGRLHFLQELNLSHNKILTIEGLKELSQLKHLDLQGNNIKTIEHLNSNVQLETLNLADNSIGSVSDISMLKSLKEFYLHGNRLSHLRQCDRYLPTSIETLTLSHNNIADLNEICTLGGLSALNSISIQENPCVAMCGNSV